MKIKTFGELHREKLKGAMKRWAKKNCRAGDLYKFILLKGTDLFILNYKI